MRYVCLESVRPDGAPRPAPASRGRELAPLVERLVQRCSERSVMLSDPGAHAQPGGERLAADRRAGARHQLEHARLPEHQAWGAPSQ